MWNFLKRSKNQDNDYRKLNSFTFDEIRDIDYILFEIYRFGSEGITLHSLHIKLDKFKYLIDNIKVDYLIRQLIEHNYIYFSFDRFIILPKGKVISEQGGLLMLWEKQKNQNYSKWISIISAVIAVCALIANLLFSYLKKC